MYLNSAKTVRSSTLRHLTLTLVVFEYPAVGDDDALELDLTLTLVVFEFFLMSTYSLKQKNLTLTLVVFELHIFDGGLFLID